MCSKSVLGYGCDERAEGTGGAEKAEVAEYTIRNTHPMHSLTHSDPACSNSPASVRHLTLLRGRPGPGVRSPGHWGWLAAPWQWASEMSLLLASRHRCQCSTRAVQSQASSEQEKQGNGPGQDKSFVPKPFLSRKHPSFYK